MPELPDVETVARRLRRTVGGRRITGVRVLAPPTVRSSPPRRFVRELTGRTVRTLARWGSYSLIRLSGARTLIVELRKAGHLELGQRATAVPSRRSVVLPS